MAAAGMIAGLPTGCSAPSAPADKSDFDIHITGPGVTVEWTPVTTTMKVDCDLDYNTALPKMGETSNPTISIATIGVGSPWAKLDFSSDDMRYDYFAVGTTFLPRAEVNLSKYEDGRGVAYAPDEALEDTGLTPGSSVAWAGFSGTISLDRRLDFTLSGQKINASGWIQCP